MIRTARMGGWLGGLALAALVFAAIHAARDRTSLDDRMMTLEPSQVLASPVLMRRAADIARPLYDSHCAGCHGSDLAGSRKRGVPNLAADAWLYGNDAVEVERTILYGIRSGHPKARNVADMPALVRSGQITRDDARDVVEFVTMLGGGDYDRQMAQRGRLVFYDKGNCYDCHANDARGVVDYGSPSLVGSVWLYGGDRETLFQSMLNGRHGLCPAWTDRLAALQIRALAVFLVGTAAASSGKPQPKKDAHADQD